MAGISAVYYNFFGDTGADSLHFFHFAIASSLLTLRDFQSVTEGAAMVIIWRTVYKRVKQKVVQKNLWLFVLLSVHVNS